MHYLNRLMSNCLKHHEIVCMKCVVVGNCQARALSILVSKLNADVTALGVVVVHLANESERQGHLDLFDDADLILSQKTSDSYPVQHVTSGFIRERYPEKTLVWPNSFYIGQTPYLRYVSHVDDGRVLSPLDAYHDLRIFKNWYEDRVGPWPHSEIDVGELRRLSLDSLSQREQGCDVTISDFIREFENSNRLFWTFNHPTNMLLVELSKRVLMRLSKPYKASQIDGPEYLARIVPPTDDQTDIVGTNIDFSQAV